MQRRSRQLVVSLIVACAMFMQNLDSTIIATALPAIGNSLGESPLRLNVAITCYLLSLAVFIPISGWTADRFGARRVFTGAIIVFTLGSIACGFAQSLWMLVLARIVQGMGGAMMVPVGRLVLRIAGYRDVTLDRSSDALCTALQLTNFWQDFGRDWRDGRLYVPQDVQRLEGAEESQLAHETLTDAWARTIER